MKRAWIPTIVVALGVAVLLVGSIRDTSQSSVSAHSRSVEQEDGVARQSDTPIQKQVIVTDAHGREVHHIGDVALHVPSNISSSGIPSGDPAGGRNFVICWTPESFPGECDSRAQNGVSLSVRPGPTTIDAYVEDGRAELANHVSSLDGPITSDIDGVWEFRAPETGRTVVYALAEPDATGKHARLSCSTTRCYAQMHVPPSLLVGVRVNKQYAKNWRQIAENIQALIGSFLIGEE